MLPYNPYSPDLIEYNFFIPHGKENSLKLSENSVLQMRPSKILLDTFFKYLES